MSNEVTPDPAATLVQLVKWYKEDNMVAIINKLAGLNETETCEQLILALSVLSQAYLGLD